MPKGGPLSFLNKKTWHPGRVQNQEEVWKRQQAALAEAKKVEDLRRQIAEERERGELHALASGRGLGGGGGEERLDWMYSGGGLAAQGAGDGGDASDAPGGGGGAEMLPGLGAQGSAGGGAGAPPGVGPSAAPSLAPLPADDAREAWRRLHSDPLMAIRQREADARKAAASDPARLRLIREEVARRQAAASGLGGVGGAGDTRRNGGGGGSDRDRGDDDDGHGSRRGRDQGQEKSRNGDRYRSAGRLRSDSPRGSSRRDRDRSPGRRSRRDGDRSPDRRSRRDGDRSPDRRSRRDRHRSPDRRSRRDSDRSPDRRSRRDGNGSADGRSRRDRDRSSLDTPRRDRAGSQSGKPAAESSRDGERGRGRREAGGEDRSGERHRSPARGDEPPSLPAAPSAPVGPAAGVKTYRDGSSSQAAGVAYGLTVPASSGRVEGADKRADDTRRRLAEAAERAAELEREEEGLRRERARGAAAGPRGRYRPSGTLTEAEREERLRGMVQGALEADAERRARASAARQLESTETEALVGRNADSTRAFVDSSRAEAIAAGFGGGGLAEAVNRRRHFSKGGDGDGASFRR